MKDKQRSTSPMKDKHTPGPWKATAHGAIEFADGFVGEAYDYNPGFDAMEGDKLPHMANARLMAAAPELLDMVQRLSDRLPLVLRREHRLYLQAKELIAKLTDQ